VEGGSIVESDLDEGDGLLVERYNARHHVVSETRYADGPAPIVFTYNRDPVSNASIDLTMSCVGPSGPVTRTASIDPLDDDAKAALFRENCLRSVKN
jgi:hypothetical protein